MAKKRRKKSKKKTNFPLWGLIFLFLLIMFGGVAYIYRHQLAYYYAIYFQPFRQQKLSNSAFENYRINKIISRHDDKIFGIDISHYQRRKDFKWDSLSIKNHDIPLDFIVMRATMGRNGKDRNFKHFWKKSQQNHYLRGAYHYYRPDENPEQQANNFVNTVRLEKGDLRPILDIEQLPIDQNHEKLVKNIKIWLRLVERKYGVKPIIYTYYHFHKDYLKNEFKTYPIWFANYNDVPQPHPNNQWDFWQFTDKGIINGINTKVDLDVFNGTLEDLKKWSIND